MCGVGGGGGTLLSTISDSVWLWDGAQYSHLALKCCLTEISGRRHKMVYHAVTLY